MKGGREEEEVGGGRRKTRLRQDMNDKYSKERVDYKNDTQGKKKRQRGKIYM